MKTSAKGDTSFLSSVVLFLEIELVGCIKVLFLHC